MNNAKAKRVEKEELRNFVPASKVVKLNPQERKDRADKLRRAMVLGNGYKNKCTIVFEDAQGLKNVETTIWMADEMHVILKGGIILPVSAIRDIII